MHYNRILNLLTLQPLELRAAANGQGIGPEHRTFIEAVHARLHGPAERVSPSVREYAPKDFRPANIAPGGINAARQKSGLDPIYSYDAATNVITLDICGPLALHASLFEMDCMGVVSYDHLNEALQEIPQRYPNAKATVLNIDSPGGQTRGNMATASFVEQLTEAMPVVAYSDSIMCSAAMKIAAPADYILTSSDAEVGSIGTVLAFLDDTEYLQNLGLKWEVIASGELKGIGYGPLTEVQRDHLQSQVDAAANTFKAHMQTHRPGLTAEDMRGQSWSAATAPAALLDATNFPTLAHAQAFAATL